MKARKNVRSTKTVPELELIRRQVKELIAASYSTTEEFCFDKDLNKATVSNFLNGRKDFQVSTLTKIARALGKDLLIKLG